MDTIEVLIMGRDFRVSCEPAEREALLRAVKMVDTKMRSIRDTGRVVGIDRIAVIAALQIAHDAIRENEGNPEDALLDSEAIESRLEQMETAINQAIAKTPPQRPVAQASAASLFPE